MIKVSSLEKYGIKLDAKDELSQAFGQKVVTKFAKRDMSQIDDSSLGDICVTVGNDIGHDNTEIEQIPSTSVIPRLWTYWKPSMDWLVQQELVGYKDETDYFGEAVPVEIPTETPEEKEALDAIEKKSPYDVGAHVSDARKPIYTQAMCDAGELPPVGSKFAFSKKTNSQRIDQFQRLECTVIGYCKDLDGDDVITFCEADMGVGCMIHMPEYIKPIQTEREKRMAAASKNMSDYYFNATGFKLDSVQFNGYTESLDNAGLLK